MLDRLSQAPPAVKLAAARALHLLRNEADLSRRVEALTAADPDARSLQRAFAQG